MGRLIGSAPTLDALKTLIKQRWTWTEVYLSETKPGVFTVSNGKEVFSDLRVIQKRGRFRLEAV